MERTRNKTLGKHRKKVEGESPPARSVVGRLVTTWKKRTRTVMSRDGLLWKLDQSLPQ